MVPPGTSLPPGQRRPNDEAPKLQPRMRNLNPQHNDYAGGDQQALGQSQLRLPGQNRAAPNDIMTEGAGYPLMEDPNK